MDKDLSARDASSGEARKNNIIHGLFEVTILLKGINGFWEILVGILFFFLKQDTIYRAIVSFTESSLVKYSGQFTFDYLLRQADNFSLSAKYFLAFYFFFYGVINILLVISLLRGKLWAYPTAIFFFIIFIVYQWYRFLLHRSGLLLFFTLFDILLVVVTWLEYGRIKRLKNNLVKNIKR